MKENQLETERNDDLGNYEPKNSKSGFVSWLKKENNIFGIIGVIFLIGVLILIWYLVNWTIAAITEQNYNLLLKILIYVLFGIPAFYILKYFHDQSDNVKKEKLRIQEERKILQENLQKEKMDVFYSLQTNLNQLQDYYFINTSQAKRSFFFSILAIVFGLTMIFVGIVFYYMFSDENKTTITALTSFSGILAQFIGGSYFVLYKKSISQLNYFYSQLVNNIV